MSTPSVWTRGILSANGSRVKPARNRLGSQLHGDCMHILKVRVSKLRCIDKLTLSFQAPGARRKALDNVTVLLGDNSTGKTTVLRAIALSILGDSLAQSGFVPYHLIRQSEPEASVEGTFRAHAVDGAPMGTPTYKRETKLIRLEDSETLAPPEDNTQRHWLPLFQNRSPAFFVLGYGVGRRQESSSAFDSSLRSKSRLLRYQRIAGLFEDGYALKPLAHWLRPLQLEAKVRFQECVGVLRDLMPDSCDFRGHFADGDYWFTLRGMSLPYSALSDGYKAYIAWASDMLANLVEVAPPKLSLIDLQGVVLIDEIDLHLHPSWQRLVVPQIARAFPAMQFVLTTHSPIVAGTVFPENVRILALNPDGLTYERRIDAPLFGRNSDQILVSEYFGLLSTRAPEAVDALARMTVGRSAPSFEDSLLLLRRLTDGFSRADISAKDGKE